MTMRTLLCTLTFASLAACATTSKSQSQRLPSQPQTVNAEFCQKLMADQTALAARTAQVNGAAPADPAVDASYRRSQQMCADLVKDTPQN
jgi:hypothetical protein